MDGIYQLIYQFLRASLLRRRRCERVRLKENDPMNRRDQELLDKQFRWLHDAPRNDGALALGVIVVFLAGISLGGAVFAHTGTKQFVSNDLSAAILRSDTEPAR